MITRFLTFVLTWIVGISANLQAQQTKLAPTHEDVAYGTGSEVLDLYLPKSQRPVPVFVFGHAKGQTLKHVPRDTIKRLMQARIAFVSVEANDSNGDGRQAIHDPKTWNRIVRFLDQHATEYRLDMDNLFVGGRSMGSIGAFPYAMQHSGRIRGVFCAQAIPDRGNLLAPLVTTDSPPCRFIFKTAVGSKDHDPINGLAIREAYRKQGIGTRFQMKTSVDVQHWYDDLHHFIARHRSGTIEDYDPARFAGAIGAFDRQDKAEGVPKGGTVFVGSSSIARLDREVVFPDHPMTLRGLRGGHISDLNHYADQVALQYEPARVVFFCGGNDLWIGHTPEEVVEDFQEFTQRLFERVPDCKVIQLAVRPSIKKRDIIPIVLRTNKMLEENAAKDDRIIFLRGSCDRFLEENGEPIEKLYHADRNHMSPAGYAIWSDIVTPHLGKPAAEGPKQSSAKKEPELRRLDRADSVHVYRTLGETKLRIYRFKSRGNDNKDRRPAIIFFHGGGWKKGTPASMAPHCRYFASRGLVCFTAEYRFAKDGGPVSVHDCVDDARSAIRYVAKHASEFGIDADRIITSGGSAGGHLAMLTAMTAPHRDSVVACMLFNPVSVLTSHPSLDDRFNTEMQRRKSILFDSRPEAICPISNIEKGQPPMLLMHGSKDWLLPAAQLFCATTVEAGNVCEIEIWPGQDHGFYHLGKNKNRNYIETCAAADRFLVRHGWLVGEPTIEAFAKQHEIR